MSTKEPINRQARIGDQPGWHLYSEMFDPDHVYLELDGIAAEITMTGNMERPPGTVLLRLPVATAKQLRLVPESWDSSAVPESTGASARREAAASRLASLGKDQSEMKEVPRRRSDVGNSPNKE